MSRARRTEIRDWLGSAKLRACLNPRQACAIVFIIFISLPAGIHVVRGSVAILTDEKSFAAALPPLPPSAEQVDTFVRHLDNYLRDNFGLRNWLLTHYHLFKYRFFGDYETGAAHVLFGKNGWLFLTKFQQIDAERGRLIVPPAKLQ